MNNKDFKDNKALKEHETFFSKYFKLSPEALMLDTPAFILKSALTMMFTFALARYIPLASRDMISVLFAAMLSLEPVSTTGFKRGKDQFIATLTGGVVSAVIVAIVGITPLGLGLSIAAVLYLTLGRNWRDLSVVALFTAIYMTQFVQMDGAGNPDILLTMMVRIIALSTGICFAMLFNILASILLMRHLPKKRIRFLKYRLMQHSLGLKGRLELALDDQGQGQGQAPDKSIAYFSDSSHLEMSSLFNDIDWNIGLLSDLAIDKLLPLGRLPKEEVDQAITMAKSLRTYCHYLFDMEVHLRTATQKDLTKDHIAQLMARLEGYICHFGDGA